MSVHFRCRARRDVSIVGSLFGWKSFWQNRNTTLDFPTALSPARQSDISICSSHRSETASKAVRTECPGSRFSSSKSLGIVSQRTEQYEFDLNRSTGCRGGRCRGRLSLCTSSAHDGFRKESAQWRTHAYIRLYLHKVFYIKVDLSTCDDECTTEKAKKQKSDKSSQNGAEHKSLKVSVKARSRRGSARRIKVAWTGRGSLPVFKIARHCCDRHVFFVVFARAVEDERFVVEQRSRRRHLGLGRQGRRQ